MKEPRERLVAVALALVCACSVLADVHHGGGDDRGGKFVLVDGVIAFEETLVRLHQHKDDRLGGDVVSGVYVLQCLASIVSVMVILGMLQFGWVVITTFKTHSRITRLRVEGARTPAVGVYPHVSAVNIIPRSPITTRPTVPLMKNETAAGHDKTCIVCRDNKVTISQLCGHAIYCYKCACVVAAEENPLCAVCRVPIETFVKLYL